MKRKLLVIFWSLCNKNLQNLEPKKSKKNKKKFDWKKKLT
jgi:hypothetical protein